MDDQCGPQMPGHGGGRLPDQGENLLDLADLRGPCGALSRPRGCSAPPGLKKMRSADSTWLPRPPVLGALTGG